MKPKPKIAASLIVLLFGVGVVFLEVGWFYRVSGKGWAVDGPDILTIALYAVLLLGWFRAIWELAQDDTDDD